MALMCGYVWGEKKGPGVGTALGLRGSQSPADVLGGNRSLVNWQGSEESHLCVFVSVTVGASCILSEGERYDSK